MTDREEERCNSKSYKRALTTQSQKEDLSLPGTSGRIKRQRINEDAIILGYTERDDEEKEICLLSFTNYEQLLEVYPRGHEPNLFAFESLDQRQCDRLSSIRQLFALSLCMLEYDEHTRAWRNLGDWDPKQKEIEEQCFSSEMESLFGWKGPNIFTECRLAFSKGMHNSYGRALVYHILDIAVGLLPKENKYHNMNVGGNNPQYEGGFQVYAVDIHESSVPRHGDSPNTACIKKAELALAMNHSEPFGKRRKIPDGQVFRTDKDGISIILSAVVKPDIEANDEFTYQETWIQAVGGLMKREVTHGITVTCKGGQLIKLMKDSKNRCIKTAVEYYDFKRPDKSFNIENFWSFFLGLVQILKNG